MRTTMNNTFQKEQKQAEQKQRKRKTRSDKGVYQLTKRDFDVLTWIADQYAMRFDQVRQLLVSDSGGGDQGGTPRCANRPGEDQ